MAKSSTEENKFGKTLRSVRRSHDLKQETVAAILKVSPTYIHRLESGKRPPLTPGQVEELRRGCELGEEDARRLLETAHESTAAPQVVHVDVSLPVRTELDTRVAKLLRESYAFLTDEFKQALEANLAAGYRAALAEKRVPIVIQRL